MSRAARNRADGKRNGKYKGLARYLRVVPEWASVLVGVAGGIGATIVGVYYGEWLRDRRARRKQGAELVARVRGLLNDANPAGFVLATMQERNERHVRELWARWYHELRQPFDVFGLTGSPDVREAQKQAATDVALAIQAVRNAVVEPGSSQRALLRSTAEVVYERARESLDRLEERL